MSALRWLLLLARKVGPDTVQVVRTYGPRIAANPQVAQLARQLVASAGRAQQARSPQVRLRRTIGVVQAKAGTLRTAAAGPGADPAQPDAAADWERRSYALLHAVDLLDVQRGGARRASLRRIEAEVDALMAEVLTALVEGPATGGKASGIPAGNALPGEPSTQ